MRHLTAIVAALFLAACAGPRYQAVHPAAEGQYFIASSAVHYDASYYGAFQTYGIYPWWEYGYYSPNFYPHYFAVWYPPWPYGFYGHYGHYGRYDRYGHGFRPYLDQPHGNWAGHANPPSQAPGEVVPAPTVRVPDPPAGRRGGHSSVDVTDPGPHPLRRRHWPTQPVPSLPAAPSVSAATKSMPIRSPEPFAGTRTSPLAPRSRPATQVASPRTQPQAPPMREHGISRRARSTLEPDLIQRHGNRPPRSEGVLP
jgi:hypothetical protein